MAIGEMPAHTHERGTMNITGSVSYVASGYGEENSTAKGAFIADTWHQGAGYNNAGGSGTLIQNFRLDASKSWTGATSEVGSDNAHNNIQPYIAVFLWKRVS